ncbi:hypothetical protein [Nocardioides bruguierae]|uniref:hypothetical protein n=1 Tax=Nocardioides bruguierae TaxID=2945102 RepID=UPI0020206949|nr:hypothetical protein [Nocardioides bruguierae]MCL8026818.1 hypothetical protein [Nocardioides bruguierae]
MTDEEPTSTPPPSWPRRLSAVAEVAVLVTLASLPVVTALAAGAAGASLLREQLTEDRDPTVGRFLHLTGSALRDPVGVLAVAGLLVLGAIDLLAVLGGLPGAVVLGPVLAVLAAAALVSGLRATALWRPGARWAPTLESAARGAVADVTGSLLLLAAVAAVVLVVRLGPAFVLLVPGLLVLAAVAVTERVRGPR